MVLEFQILIRELRAIDGYSASTVPSGKIASLSHEVSNNSVEEALLVSVALFIIASAERPEVLGCLWAVVCV